MKTDTEDVEWAIILGNASLPQDLELISISIGNKRRLYLSAQYNAVFKIAKKANKYEPRNNSLEEEYKLFQKASGIAPKTYNFQSLGSFDYFSYEYIEGKTLDKWDGRFHQCLIVWFEIIKLLTKLSFKSIVHNDLNAGNIIIKGKRSIRLIDYDQSVCKAPIKSLFYNFTGLPIGKNPLRTGLPKVTAQLFRKFLPHAIESILEKRINLMDARRLPNLPKDAAPYLHEIKRAWKIAQRSGANAPGKKLCYYSLEIDGYSFPGERPWKERWETLRSITPLKGKRILEIGCNLGLLSCMAIKEEGAIAALGVDHNTKILEAAEIIATSLGVKIEFIQGDVAKNGEWQDRSIQFKPDIVFALSVLNWVSDKNAFMKYLANFNEVVFEGHDHVELEISRFKDAGFNTTNLIGHSERERPVLHCRKE